MRAGLYGKHPARGDFLWSGVEGQVLRGLESWLDAALAEARAGLGEAWATAWDGGPILRFWLGEDVLGTAACGVMAPSRDRVGRRFPLLLLRLADMPGAAPAPPVIDPRQTWYTAAESHLRALLALPPEAGAVGSADAMLAALPAAPAPDATALPGPADFWAAREAAGDAPGMAEDTGAADDPGAAQDGWAGGSWGTSTGAGGAQDVPDTAAALLADIALTDHRRAAAARSYWWTEAVKGTAARPARFHAGPGLPGGAVLAWFLTPPPPAALAEAARVPAPGTTAHPPVAAPLAESAPPPEVWDDSPFDTPPGAVLHWNAPDGSMVGGSTDGETVDDRGMHRGTAEDGNVTDAVLPDAPASDSPAPDAMAISGAGDARKSDAPPVPEASAAPPAPPPAPAEQTGKASPDAG